MYSMRETPEALKKLLTYLLSCVHFALAFALRSCSAFAHRSLSVHPVALWVKDASSLQTSSEHDIHVCQWIDNLPPKMTHFRKKLLIRSPRRPISPRKRKHSLSSSSDEEDNKGNKSVAMTSPKKTVPPRKKQESESSSSLSSDETDDSSDDEEDKKEHRSPVKLTFPQKSVSTLSSLKALKKKSK